MTYDRELVAGKLRRWESYLQGFRLPEWKDIPDFGLYMDQVLILLRQYLDIIPPEYKEEQLITAAAVNNYVRKKIMPEPVKKKYYRRHIAYLIMICTLKQSLSIATLQTMIPLSMSEEEVRRTYTEYAARHQLTAGYFIGQIKEAAAGILGAQSDSDLCTDSTADLITSATVISGLSRLLAEKLLLLDGLTAADADISVKDGGDGADAEDGGKEESGGKPEDGEEVSPSGVKEADRK